VDSKDLHVAEASGLAVDAPPSGPRDAVEERTTAIDLEDVRKGGDVVIDQACLVVIYGPELGRRATLVKSIFEIGRSSRADLLIDQESVSRHHAQIFWDGLRHTLIDLGSTNGTFINDQSVTERVLADGDQIKIGQSILKYMAGDNVEAAYHEVIYRLMTTDTLTQTYNRRYFNEALDREYHRSLRYQCALSLVIFDIDHFKDINDTYGHVAGDNVLRQLALVVKPRLRSQDIFARVGGEEFAVMLPEVELAGARIAADKVRKLVETARFSIDDPNDQKEIGCTVSAGVASFDEHMASPTMLYEKADAALYIAKNLGRNRISG